jgi:aspartate carbamoyltransferase regulatory subunit
MEIILLLLMIDGMLNVKNLKIVLNFIFGNIEKGCVIDHINGNSLDNRMSNLDPVTNGVNNYNRETQNKYGYTGINKNGNKFCAQLNYEGKKYYTTVFETVEEAALAYNELSKKYYKHRATINLIKN